MAPTYEAVCTKTTGHAEAVAVTYRPDELPHRRLLTEFFTLHDFARDRRGGGGQYRSAIFVPPATPHTDRQLAVAREQMTTLAQHDLPPSTDLRVAGPFYPAAVRHQQYCSARGVTPKRRVAHHVRQILTP